MDIFNIDLHYHAGLERDEGVSLRDYLEYAQMTGRKILGITDHYDLYFEPKEAYSVQDLNYERSFDGLKKYQKEIASLKDAFPQMKLFFAPEICPGIKLDTIPLDIIEISDFFICEPPAVKDSVSDNTAGIVEKLFEISDFVKKTGKSAYLAHPFRSSVNERLVTKDIQPWIRDISYRTHWTEFTYEEIDNFFMFDIKEVARAAKTLSIPLEMNGNTQFRVRSCNLPPVLQMLWGAYQIIADEKAEIVPGSDLHGFMNWFGKMGQYIPYDCFSALGITYNDINFIKKI